MTLATKPEAPQDHLSDEEVDAMLDAVKSVLYTSDLLCSEWALKDLTVVGIAERIVDMALPLFKNEGEEDDQTAAGFLFHANPRVSFEAFVAALVVAGLPRMLAIMTDIESHISAQMHAAGRTELGWPLAPKRGVPRGVRADGTIIHPVLPEEGARARYLEALENETSHPGFLGFLREYLEEAMMPSQIWKRG